MKVSRFTLLVGFAFTYGALALADAGCAGGDALDLLPPSSPGEGDAGGAAGTDATGEGGAGAGGEGSAGAPVVDPVADLYPTGRTLYEKAIAPSCALNEGLCHNDGGAHPEHAFSPVLTALDDFAGTIGAACQQRVGGPSGIVNNCEREGDHLVFDDGTDRVILSATLAADAPSPPDRVVIVLDGPAGSGALSWRRAALNGGSDELSTPLAAVIASPGGAPNELALDFRTASPDLAVAFDLRIWPRPANGLLVGDPNGDGTPGASLGWREIVPGDPTKSFLYQLLLSDALGTQMPLVRGTWSPAETRAVYCFIRGLSLAAPDMEAPIDYGACPEDPNAPKPVFASFAVTSKILQSACAFAGCHNATAPAAGLDLTPTRANFEASLINVPSNQSPSVARIVPGDPAASYLFCKVDPACEGRAPETQRMPLGMDPLGETALASLRAWITAGAPLE